MSGLCVLDVLDVLYIASLSVGEVKRYRQTMQKVTCVALATLTITLAACDEYRAPVLETISGTLVELDTDNTTDPRFTTKAWTGGVGTVTGTVGFQSFPLGTISKDGQFTLNLPSTLDEKLLKKLAHQFPEGGKCKNSNLEISDREARLAYLNVFVDADKKGQIVNGFVIIDDQKIVRGDEDKSESIRYTKKREGGLIYFDRPVRIMGTQNCTETDKTTKLKYTVQRSVIYKFSSGWNMINSNIDIEGREKTKKTVIKGESGSLPSKNWIFK